MTKQMQVMTASGYCKMGHEIVPVYELKKKIWFEKKALERVLTGKNQHNLLGQTSDPKNHSILIDGETSRLVEIISENGVKNYLKRARTVSDERKQTYYDGVKTVTKSKPEVYESEPIQPQLTIMPYVKIEKSADGQYVINYWTGSNDKEEERKNALSMLSESIAVLVRQN